MVRFAHWLKCYRSWSLRHPTITACGLEGVHGRVKHQAFGVQHVGGTCLLGGEREVPTPLRARRGAINVHEDGEESAGDDHNHQDARQDEDPCMPSVSVCPSCDPQQGYLFLLMNASRAVHAAVSAATG